MSPDGRGALGVAGPDAAPVSRGTEDRLQAFLVEFRKWAARINLVAPSTLADAERRHVADSAQIFALAQARHPHLSRVIDLGSGGGFPGLILAIQLAETTGAEVHLVEAVAKKCAFLRHVARELALPAIIHNGRIEDIMPRLPQPDIVTARALAALPLLLALASPKLAAGATAFFHKGREWREEVAAAHGAWRFDLVVHPSGIEPGSVVLEIGRVSPHQA
jgi:16S rRNA (guanine527-N7)-methyltransferase